ncbi:MAG: hypothetical protein AAGA77_09905 [Bacteroidota bacterium]
MYIKVTAIITAFFISHSLLCQKSINLSVDLTTKAKYVNLCVDFQSQNYNKTVGIWIGDHNSLDANGFGLNYAIKTQKRERNTINLFAIAFAGYSFFRNELPISTYHIHYLDFSLGYGMEYKIGNNIYLSNSISIGANIEFITNTVLENNNILLDTSGLIRTSIIYKI